MKIVVQCILTLIHNSNESKHSSNDSKHKHNSNDSKHNMHCIDNRNNRIDNKIRIVFIIEIRELIIGFE